MTFNLHLTPYIEFGEGRLNLIGGILNKDSRRHALIITGKHSSKAQNALERVKSSLEEFNITSIVYDEIASEPDTDIVDSLRALATKEGVDSVIGLGGGSQLDTAKVVAGLLGQTEQTLEYLRGKKFAYKGVPFYAIPTTFGTASEVTLNGVFLDKEKNNKYSISDPKFMAQAAVVDPMLSYGLDPKTTAGTGMDAFTHAIESYVSHEANEFTKFFAQEAAVLALKYLDEAIEDDPTARSYMAKASLYAGIAFAQTGVGLSHAIAHPIGAMYHIPHGVANAILIPRVINFNMRTSSEAYSEIERRIGLDTGLGEYVQGLISGLPISTKLREYGFKMDDAQEIARLAMTSRSYLRNPRKASLEEIVNILEDCY